MKKGSPKKGNGKLAEKSKADTPIEAADSLKPIIWVSLALIVLNLAIYAPTLRYGFLAWDDPIYVSQNAEVLNGLSWHGFAWSFTTGHAANWHPITWLSHMLDVQLFGKAAGLHHLTNLLFHIANSMLLFWAMFRMTKDWRPSAFVAGLFAVHPMHVESVAWIAERKDVLSALFCLLAIHSYINYVRNPNFKRYLAIFAFFALGLMSKPMLVTLPLLLLLFDLWPLHRAPLDFGQGDRWRRILIEKVPLLGLSVASSIITVIVQSRGGAVTNSVPMGMRISNALVSCISYIYRMLWPANLAAYYPNNPSPIWLAGICFLALAAGTFLAFRHARNRPYLLAGWLWYLLMLLPVIGLIQVGDHKMADRYTYLPFIGLFIIAAWLISSLLERFPHRNKFLFSAAAILICAYAAAAGNQVRYWESNLSLWTRTIEKEGANNYIAHTQLGLALAVNDEQPAAIKHFMEALRIKPDSNEARVNLGLAYFRQGRLNEALTQFSEAIRIDPRYSMAYVDRGYIFQTLGKLDQAADDFRAALRIDPEDDEAHYNLGCLLADKGRSDEARRHFNEALRINPENAQALNRLGTILASQGKPGDAVAQYAKAVSIRPDLWQAHVNLGIALMNQGKDMEALERFMDALRIKPDLAQVHNNVGVILINNGRTNEAIVHFKEAARLLPNSPDIQANLNNALAPH